MNHTDYFGYLRRRSRLGGIYRRYFLYPTLNRFLKGNTLDVGCGIGDFLCYRPNTVGTDINPHAVEWCRNLGMDVTLMRADELPYKAGSFQNVVMDNVLEHIENPANIIEEVKRVLVPNGTFLVGVPGLRGYECDSDHKIFYDKNRLISVLDSHGFSAKRIIYTPFCSKWLDKHMKQYCLYGVFAAQ